MEERRRRERRGGADCETRGSATEVEKADLIIERRGNKRTRAEIFEELRFGGRGERFDIDSSESGRLFARVNKTPM